MFTAGEILYLLTVRIKLYNIAPGLQPYVKMICSMECDDEFDTRHIRVLPDACVELFISYTCSPVAIIGDELYNKSIVTFRMSRPMDVQMRKGSGCLAVCFYPGMAYQFFTHSMQAFTDKTALLKDAWADMATEIEDMVANATDNEARVSVVQQYLLQRSAEKKTDTTIAWCLQQISDTPDPVSVKQLTIETGLSQRQLSRRFQRVVGLSPVEYIGVSRFIKSLQHLKKYPSKSLTSVAYESGYYDQSHFIRDYKAYSGHTPGEVALSKNILY
jgi:AraC-like DNA-binding protein